MKRSTITPFVGIATRSLICASLWLLVSLHAARFYVAQADPRADDGGPGSAERPWRTLSKAAASVGPGATVVVRSGIYRERVVIQAGGMAARPIRFEAAPGEWVVVTGADRLTGWTKVEGQDPIFTVVWPYRFNTYTPTMTHPSDKYHRLIGRCEQVMVSGYRLRQVLALTQLAPGTFFADVSHRRLYVWDSANRDLRKLRVEASVRPEILRVEGDYVQVRGFHFRYAANAAQHGAVVLAGNHDLLEDCLVARVNASGATFRGQDLVVRRCTFLENGQLGFGANGADRLLFTDCLVEENNTKNFSRGWEAGGNKLVLCRRAVLERSRFVRNRGNGIWFDIGNEDCTVRQCLIADNEDAGIFDEISYGLHAHDNVVVGNGFADTPGAWGAQAGICLSSSPNSLIERNLLVGNREGFDFREQLRRTRTITDKRGRPVWNHDELIAHNVIAYNRDVQIGGWFDVKDNREWPFPPGARSAANTQRTASGTDAGRGSPSEDQPNPPTSPSLEQLHLKFENNVYFAARGQGLFQWGVPWRRHREYHSVAQFQAALGIDRGGRFVAPPFTDLLSRDFRLDLKSLRAFKLDYPHAPVPGALLGRLP